MTYKLFEQNWWENDMSIYRYLINFNQDHNIVTGACTGMQTIKKFESDTREWPTESHYWGRKSNIICYFQTRNRQLCLMSQQIWKTTVTHFRLKHLVQQFKTVFVKEKWYKCYQESTHVWKKDCSATENTEITLQLFYQVSLQSVTD